MQVLQGIQELLENPNADDPAQEEAWQSLNRKPTEYRRRVRQQVN
jgi:ubiquitin-conjugating enzyme E2 I